MAIRQRNNNYWKKRSIERESETTKNSQKYIRQIKSIYIKSAKTTVENVKAMYSAYYKKDDGFDKQALNKIANKGDLKRFQAEMERLGLSTYLPKNYQGRMTREKLINAQIWSNIKQLAQKEQEISTNSYQETYENNYYRTIYDTSKGIDKNIVFSTLDQKTIDKILNTKFLGENYSQRIWHNTDILANDLKTIIGQAITTGQSQEKTIRQIMEKYGTRGSAKQAYYNAQRLIRTETNYFQTQSELDSYEEMGIEKYKYLATLDLRTSEICREMDGKIFNVKDKEQGLNAPPMHPNCRSTTVPYIGKEYEPTIRIARDPKTGKNMTIGNIDYDDWYETYVEKKTEQAKETKKDNVSSNRETAEKTIAGVKKGKNMTHEEADSGKVNPNFAKDDGYKINCQSCVVAYEARLRGYDVEALPKTSESAKELAKKSWIAWNHKDGTPCSEKDYITSAYTTEKMNHVKFYNKMSEILEPNARYTFSYRNIGRENTGHIINLISDENKNFMLYDPQSNKEVKGQGAILSYLNFKVKFNLQYKGHKSNTQPRIFRVDDKEINYNVANDVMKARENDTKKDK